MRVSPPVVVVKDGVERGNNAGAISVFAPLKGCPFSVGRAVAVLLRCSVLCW